MEELKDYSEEKESNFDLKAEIFKYLAYWRWLLLGFLVGGLVAYLYNRYTIPEYWSEAAMMILDEQDKKIAGALPSGGGSVFNLSDNTLDNQIVTLRSKRLVGQVVEELNHHISYYLEGNVITTEAYKNSPVQLEFITPDSIVRATSKTFLITPISDTDFRLTDESSNYEETHRIGDIIELGELTFSVTPRTSQEGSTFKRTTTVRVTIKPVDAVAADYIGRMEIKPKGQAKDILSLGVGHPERQKSRDFLNNLMVQFNKDGVADKRQVALSTTEFIQERLELITQELDSVEGGMAEFKRENQIMDVGSGAQRYLARSTRAEQEIFDIEMQLGLIRSLQERLNSETGYNHLPANLGIKETGISGIISAYNNLVMERNAYLRNSTPQNPVVKTITDQLDALKQNLAENLNSAVNSLNLQLNELTALDRTSQNRYSSFPGMEKGIRGIERQQQIKEQLYLFLLQRREEAAIQFAITSPVAKVIDPAFTYSEPIDPKPWLILLSGFLIGLLLPTLVLFVKFMLDNKVHHKGDLASLIRNTPYLGEIPRISSDYSDVIQPNDRSSLAESFRILRTNLAYLTKTNKNDRGEVIFVTSTIKGEGKTFVSYNLARTLATTNKKVVIVGADIRNPKLHRYTTSSMEVKGLSDYLYDHDVQVEDIITESEDKQIKVDVVLSGVIPPNPAELFLSDRVEQLFKKLAQEYDYVIVDTAPTMIVTDTLLISPYADTTLYVTRAGFTEKKLLDFPKELLQQGKLKRLAVVLNDVDYSKFSYGAQYQYGYSYGYGYGQDEQPKWRVLWNRVFNRST